MPFIPSPLSIKHIYIIDLTTSVITARNQIKKYLLKCTYIQCFTVSKWFLPLFSSHLHISKLVTIWSRMKYIGASNYTLKNMAFRLYTIWNLLGMSLYYYFGDYRLSLYGVTNIAIRYSADWIVWTYGPSRHFTCNCRHRYSTKQQFYFRLYMI